MRPSPLRRRLLGFLPSLKEPEMTTPIVDADREFRQMWRDLLLFTAAFTLVLVVMLTYKVW